MATSQRADAGTEDLVPRRADLGKVLDFMRLLWALDHALQSKSKRMARDIGVTGLQRMVIRIIGRFPLLSAGGLAQILYVDPSTLTGVFTLLEARRLIEREADPEDGRRVRFRLAPLGHKLNDLREGTVESNIERALARIAPAKLAATRDVLEELTRALSESPGHKTVR